MRPRHILPLLLVLTASCGPSEDRSPSPDQFRVQFPEARIVSSHDVVCVPGARFQVPEGAAVWRMQATAQVLCSVTRAPGTPLTFRMEAAGDTQRFRFEVLWDGQPLTSGPVAVTDDDALMLELPPDEVQPGLHRLRLQRVYEPVAAPVKAFHDNTFHWISYEVAGRSVDLNPADASHLQFAGRLLERGVTGLTSELRSGRLLDGTQTADVSVEAPVAGILDWVVENTGSRPATFRVEARGRSWQSVIPARKRGRLETPVSAGRSELRIRVVSASSSPEAEPAWYSWSRPSFRSTAGSKGSEARPPIVLLTLDTTRRDALSPYGESPEVTPTIDSFARQATVFERAYSPSPWTLPAHASMMTGLYPSRHGAGVSYPRVPEDSSTLAELLGRAGYRTAGFPGSRVSSSLYGVSRGFDVFRDPAGHQVPGDVMTGRLVRFLSSNKSDAPLFLFANYFDPHILYRAPPEYQEKLKVPSLAVAIQGHPTWEQLAQGQIGAWTDIIEGKAPATPGILRWLRASYLAEVAFMDAQIGRLFDTLREQGLYDEAVIVLVADHGELLGEGGQFSHSARLDPELVEVPLLIKWPGQQEARRVDDLVSITDLFPTLLAAGGVEAPSSDGRLLTPDGVAEGDEPRPRVFLEEHESLVHPLIPGQKVADHLYGVQALRTHRVVWPSGQICLGRRDEAWHSVDCPPDGDRVYDHLRSLLGTGTTAVPEAAGGVALSPEEREALEALGYL